MSAATRSMIGFGVRAISSIITVISRPAMGRETLPRGVGDELRIGESGQKRLAQESHALRLRQRPLPDAPDELREYDNRQR